MISDEQESAGKVPDTERGYVPGKGHRPRPGTVDTSRPPQGGSGVPSKPSTGGSGEPKSSPGSGEAEKKA